MTITSTPVRGAARSAQTELTRGTIVAAAHRVFVERGYRSTSLRDVAAAAEISRAGLQRHFATKDTLLAAVVDSFLLSSEKLFTEQMPTGEQRRIDFGIIARHNEQIPGYMALYAALNGEASTATHPAHDLLRDRYARLIALASEAIDDAIRHDVVSSDRDPRGEAIRTIAGWDGLQLLAQYLPERIDVVGMVETRQQMLSSPIGWSEAEDSSDRADPAPVPPRPGFLDDTPPVLGYRVGRERRTRIIEDATALFAREGYADTSLSDVARAVGVSKSTLLHHYPSKEELLNAVLIERDRTILSRVPSVKAARAADELRAIPHAAAEDASSAPGLIQVHAVLSCEAVPADHPAHAYFVERFREEIDYFAALMRAAQHDGDLPSHRDPETEAVWLAALWEGLQYQWLYDPDSVDVAAHLTAHLDDILRRD